jgi:sigma-B regulation protein RsbU (phosphoserine phosphatase)
LPDESAFAKRLKLETIELMPGDRLFIYSDGVTEAMNRIGEKYGTERLMDIFKENMTYKKYDNPKKISSLILDDLDSHCGLASQADDITFLTITVPRKSVDDKSDIDTKKVD